MDSHLLSGGGGGGGGDVVSATERPSALSTVKDWLKRKVLDPLKDVVKAGITPEKLALSLALGVTCGLWPIPGTTAILCLAATLLCRVNNVVAQVVNFVLAPLELLCIPLFFKFGNWVLQGDPIPFSAKEMIDQLKKDFFGTLVVFKDIVLKAMFGWLLLAVPITLLCYLILWPSMGVIIPYFSKSTTGYQSMDDGLEESFMLDEGDADIHMSNDPYYSRQGVPLVDSDDDDTKDSPRMTRANASAVGL